MSPVAKCMDVWTWPRLLIRVSRPARAGSQVGLPVSFLYSVGVASQATPRTWTAFLSYSQAEDDIARALRRSIELTGARTGRTVRIFHPGEDAVLGSNETSSVLSSLTESGFLILLLSEKSGSSAWVDSEVQQWFRSRMGNLILVHLSGELHWDRSESRFSETSTALPPSLRNRVFPEEPIWHDLTWLERSLDKTTDSRWDSLVLDILARLTSTSLSDLRRQAERKAARKLTLPLAVAVSSVLFVTMLAFASQSFWGGTTLSSLGGLVAAVAALLASVWSYARGRSSASPLVSQETGWRLTASGLSVHVTSKQVQAMAKLLPERDRRTIEHYISATGDDKTGEGVS